MTDDSRPLRTWYQHQCARIMLVHAPITFGHSQLELSFVSGIDERSRFRQAAKLIECAIHAFNQVLTPEVLAHFDELANVTKSRGRYVKTLVLRASAQENVDAIYKVHLLPFVTSHDDACKKRYTGVHGLPSETTGGMLGWLGDRENIVDTWQVDGDHCFGIQLDNMAIDKWKLHELAERLKCAWPTESPHDQSRRTSG